MTTIVSTDLSLQGGHVAREPRIREVVIVAPTCDRFGDFVIAGERGEVGLHFCVDGRSALRLARRFRADVWLVSADLPDMSGLDLLEMLLPAVAQGDVDPLRGGARMSLAEIGTGLRSGVFVVADRHSFEDERRVLRAGAAGYLAGPVSIDMLREARGGATRPVASRETATVDAATR
jgi:CheY-like chemotaxis protein